MNILIKEYLFILVSQKVSYFLQGLRIIFSITTNQINLATTSGQF